MCCILSIDSGCCGCAQRQLEPMVHARRVALDSMSKLLGGELVKHIAECLGCSGVDCVGW